MKKITTWIPIITTIVASCSKDEMNNGSILAKTIYQNNRINASTVCISRDSNKIPIECKTEDANGEVYFKNLPPGNYYISAQSYLYSMNIRVCGENMIQIFHKTRHNHYDIAIDMQLCK